MEIGQDGMQEFSFIRAKCKSSMSDTVNNIYIYVCLVTETGMVHSGQCQGCVPIQEHFS